MNTLQTGALTFQLNIMLKEIEIGLLTLCSLLLQEAGRSMSVPV